MCQCLPGICLWCKLLDVPTPFPWTPHPLCPGSFSPKPPSKDWSQIRCLGADFAALCTSLFLPLPPASPAKPKAHPFLWFAQAALCHLLDRGSMLSLEQAKSRTAPCGHIALPSSSSSPHPLLVMVLICRGPCPPSYLLDPWRWPLPYPPVCQSPAWPHCPYFAPILFPLSWPQHRSSQPPQSVPSQFSSPSPGAPELALLLAHSLAPETLFPQPHPAQSYASAPPKHSAHTPSCSALYSFAALFSPLQCCSQPRTKD